LGRPANWRETLTACDAKRRGAKAPTPKERGEGGDRRDCYWLYVATDCDAQPRLHVQRDPASLPWHEVTKVAHSYLSVDALTQPMQAREERPEYGGQR
jgi:hypothetical protein